MGICKEVDMKKQLKIGWLSAGISSFIAIWLVRNSIDRIIYIDIDDHHKDNKRFVKDCERILGKPIEILRHWKYNSVEDVIRDKKIIRHVKHGYAPCTNELKIAVREKWESEHQDFNLTYIWGYDIEEIERAKSFEKNIMEKICTEFFYIKNEFPLIDKQFTKQDCHAMAKRLGIKRPVLYDMGYQNNNCIGCVKGGMGYWNDIRKDFPKVFESRAKLEREINRRCLKECFLDELDPSRGYKTDEISTECGLICMVGGIA